MTAALGVLTGIPPAQQAGFLGHFAPAEVAILDGHDGKTIGWVGAVMAESRNVWFQARLFDADTIARLRRGPVAVSVEAEGRSVAPSPNAGSSSPNLPRSMPYYWGTRGRPGWTLVGIAVLRAWERPARPGSALWLAS